MKYKCLNDQCEETFLFPAKRTSTTYNARSLAEVMVEKHICPYCYSEDIDEIKLEQEKITSLVSVPIEEVDALIKQGYMVHETFAKTATLKKITDQDVVKNTNAQIEEIAEAFERGAAKTRQEEVKT